MVHNSDPHEFDDEFDDDDPLPVIGHCKALYSFDGKDGQNDHVSRFLNAMVIQIHNVIYCPEKYLLKQSLLSFLTLQVRTTGH